MEQTSLEKFNSLVDTNYTALRKYISFSSEEKIIIEDYENFAWGKNADLNPLFESPNPFPIKKIDVSYDEKSCMFLIIIILK